MKRLLTLHSGVSEDSAETGETLVAETLVAGRGCTEKAMRPILVV